MIRTPVTKLHRADRAGEMYCVQAAEVIFPMAEKAGCMIPVQKPVITGPRMPVMKPHRADRAGRIAPVQTVAMNAPMVEKTGWTVPVQKP